MLGKNSVELIGKLRYPKLSEVGAGFAKFSAKLSVPAEYFFDDGTKTSTNTDVKIVAWFDLAERLGEVNPGSTVKIHGYLQERSYDGKCRSCGSSQKKYWSDVLISNFVVIDE